LRGGGLPGAGTYAFPSLNHAGCVITTSGVFSFFSLYASVLKQVGFEKQGLQKKAFSLQSRSATAGLPAHKKR